MESHKLILRPTLTQEVTQYLIDGKSINVFGANGNGLDRLVEDLKNNLPTSSKLVRLNMSSYATNYKAFLNELIGQLGIGVKNKQSWSHINSFLDNSSNKIWLILENFDRLSETNTDKQGYDNHFLSFLNSLSNRSNVSLLLTSQHKIAAQELYIGAEPVSGSILDLSRHIALPVLTAVEIEAFFCQITAYNNIFFQSPKGIRLTAAISQQLQPIDFLEHIARSIPKMEIVYTWTFAVFEQWISEQLEYQKQPHSFGLKLNKAEKSWRNTTQIVTRLSHLWKSIKQTLFKFWKLLLSISIFLFGIWNWGAMIKETLQIVFKK